MAFTGLFFGNNLYDIRHFEQTDLTVWKLGSKVDCNKRLERSEGK